MGVSKEPAVRLNPDFSVAQVDADRRTVVLLYGAGGDPEAAEGSLPWLAEAEGPEVR